MLQIHQLNVAQPEISISSSDNPETSTEPSFGPVLLHEPPPEDRPSTLTDRMTYLIGLAHGMAESVFTSTASWAGLKYLTSVRERSFARERALRRLTAYFLFTTFNEKLEYIQRYMRMATVGRDILAAVHDAKRPLRPEAAEMLHQWIKVHHEELAPHSLVDSATDATKIEKNVILPSHAAARERLAQKKTPQPTKKGIKKTKLLASVTSRRVSSKSRVTASVTQKQPPLTPAAAAMRLLLFADFSASPVTEDHTTDPSNPVEATSHKTSEECMTSEDDRIPMPHGAEAEQQANGVVDSTSDGILPIRRQPSQPARKLVRRCVGVTLIPQIGSTRAGVTPSKLFDEAGETGGKTHTHGVITTERMAMQERKRFRNRDKRRKMRARRRLKREAATAATGTLDIALDEDHYPRQDNGVESGESGSSRETEPSYGDNANTEDEGGEKSWWE